MIRWGTVTTTNAPLPRILDFAAWHLDQGAARVVIYLDAPDPGAEAALRAHPRIRLHVTDDAWWQARKGRPAKHQLRQGANARHANGTCADLDWLAHIDVDEFLLPATPQTAPLADQLAALPARCLCARIRPVEALAPPEGHTSAETLFKAFPLDQQARRRAAEACFPIWGRHLSGGFLSHVAGKLIFRPGSKGLQIRIHNLTLDGIQNPGEEPLPGMDLGHFHAPGWESFLAAYRFRLAQGSYRAELTRSGTLSHHDLLRQIEATGGQPALRAFFDEICTASPDLVDRLAAHGLLRRHHMDLPARVARQFPGLS